MAVNRSRLGVVLEAALADMPAQAQRSAEFAGWEAEINAYHVVSQKGRVFVGRVKRTQGLGERC